MSKTFTAPESETYVVSGGFIPKSQDVKVQEVNYVMKKAGCFDKGYYVRGNLAVKLLEVDENISFLVPIPSIVVVDINKPIYPHITNKTIKIQTTENRLRMEALEHMRDNFCFIDWASL